MSHKFPGVILWWVWCVCVVTKGCRGMWRRQIDSSIYSMWRSSWRVACVSEILRLTMVNTKWVTELETIKEDTSSASGTKQFNLHLTWKLRKQSKIIVIYYLFCRWNCSGKISKYYDLGSKNGIGYIATRILQRTCL